MSETKNPMAGDAREYITFRIGVQEFCIDIMSVREIRGWTPATILPHAPIFVRGVINLRGVVLPIIDLAERLGFAPTVTTARHAIIVVNVGVRSMGLLVDVVSDIITQDSNHIQPTPDVASDMAKSFVHGVLAIEGRMISLIGIEGLMPESIGVAA
jgi:purine-binding chemotaxis protein CheW